MSPSLAIIGTTIVGGFLGLVIGAWYGEATDHGDLPMGFLLGFPGMIIGGFLGVVAGVLIFV